MVMPFQFLVLSPLQNNQGNNPASMHAQRAMCLLPNSCMGNGVLTMALYAAEGKEITFANMWSPAGKGVGMPFAEILIILAIDLVWVTLLAAYLELVVPQSSGGLPLHPLFPLMWLQQCYCCTEQRIDDEADSRGADGGAMSVCVSEPLDRSLAVGLRTDNLTKVFTNRTGSVTLWKLPLPPYSSDV
jgi:hypothetical protein